MGTYTVKKGDTLGALARKYGTSVSALAKANNIHNVNRLSIGQRLNINGYNQASTPAPSAPAQNPLDQWLAGDSTYQSQLANYNKSRADYDAQWWGQKNNTTRDYDISTRALNQQGEVDRDNQMNDYAGRGVLNSGVYGTALADYNQNFNTKLQNLLQGKNDSLANQENAKTNFYRQLQFEMDAAKQDAIRRRAQQLGI